eukprot:jgi/Chlat1/8539/Chrsp82S07971
MDKQSAQAPAEAEARRAVAAAAGGRPDLACLRPPACLPPPGRRPGRTGERGGRQLSWLGWSRLLRANSRDRPAGCQLCPCLAKALASGSCSQQSD